MEKSRQFTRQELYELVWNKPILTLAKELGLSDRGLAKICERHSIPVPPRGHWAKKASGKAVKRPPLVILDVERHFNINISATIKRIEEEPSTIPPEIQQLIDDEATPKKLITVPKTLSNPHPIIAAWLEKEREEAENHRRWYSFYYEPRFNSSIQKRRLRILSTLFKELEKRGYKVKKEHYRPYDVQITAGSDAIGFSLEEKIKQYKVELSEEEKRKRPNQKWTQIREASGLLQFKIVTGLWNKMQDTWIDEPDHPVETQLNKIMSGFTIAALYLKQRRVQKDEDMRLRWEAEDLKRQKEEIARKEKERLKCLEDQAEAWNKAKQIRTYVQAVQAQPGLMTSKELKEWIRWALNHADQLDPITSRMILKTKPTDQN